jgi:hypothetical protein
VVVTPVITSSARLRRFHVEDTLIRCPQQGELEVGDQGKRPRLPNRPQRCGR